MASLLVRLESHSAAGYSLIGRVCTGYLRSTNSQFHSSNNNKNNLGHRSMNFSSASKMSPPRLMLPPAAAAFDNMTYRMYNLAEDRVETPYRSSIIKEEELGAQVVGSSHGWLALLFNNTKLFLSNPLTCTQIKLPPLDSLLNPPPPPPDDDDDDENCDFTVSKVILSCSPSDEECRVLMSYGFGFPDRLAFCFPGKSTHWNKLGEDEPDDSGGYSDTIYSARHKLFFCITKKGCFQVCDLHYHRVLGFASDFNWLGKLEGWDRLYKDVLRKSKVQPEVWEQLYLVEHPDPSSGQLFLVRRHIMARVGHDGASYARPFCFGYRRGWDNSHPYKTVGFDVHKIDWDLKRGKANATYVEPGSSLDGLAMFVGLNHSFGLSADEFRYLKHNSIYFTDAMRDKTTIESADRGGCKARTSMERADWGEKGPDWDTREPHSEWVDRIYGGHDIGIYDFDDRTISPCYYPCDVPSIKRINPPPFWFCSS